MLTFSDWKNKITKEAHISAQTTIINTSATTITSPTTTLTTPTTTTMTSPTTTLTTPTTTMTARTTTLTTPTTIMTTPTTTMTSPTTTMTTPTTTLTTPTTIVTTPTTIMTTPTTTLTTPTTIVTTPTTTLTTPTTIMTTPTTTLTTPTTTESSTTISPSTAATDTYQSASWTGSSDWRRYIVADNNNSGSPSDADLPYDQSTMVKMEKGINLSPSLDRLCLTYPASGATIESMFEEMKLECGPVPACAVAFRSWADSFKHRASKQLPAGHILDALMICQDKRLQMWVCVEAQGDVDKQKSHKTYAYELCRVLLKQMLLEKISIEAYCAVNVQITPVLFYADVNKANTALHAGDLIAELNSASMSSVSGVRLEGLQSAVISLLDDKNVWITNRVGCDMTYHLTKQQINGLRQSHKQRISLIEAAPGCGKSIMAISVCQRFRPDEVLYMSPSRGFTSLITYQKVATSKHVRNDQDMREAITEIRHRIYRAVVVDDVQAMDICAASWTSLLEAIYIQYTTKILFLVDSKFQDFYNSDTYSQLKQSVDRFCENKRVLSPYSISLSENMRNCRKVFTFLKAQILKEPGVGLVNADLTSGHSVDGDDVVVRYLDDPWLDSADNELIKLVQGLIDPQNERGYEARDIVILVDNKTQYAGIQYILGWYDEPDRGDEPDSVLRRIFKKRTTFKVHTARDLPHKGLVIDSVDEFTGMEATVCVVLLSETDDKRSHTNMKYRMFVASRGIMRTELILLRPFDRDVTSMMALEDTATAEKYTQAALLWEKDVSCVWSVTFLLHHGRHVVLYTVYDGFDFKLLAMTMARDPVTDLPPAFTAVSNLYHVCVSRDQAWAVMYDRSRSCTTLVRQGDDWRKHKTYRDLSYSDPSYSDPSYSDPSYSDPSYSVPPYITAVTITPDGEVALLTQDNRLYKYDVSGVLQWEVKVLMSRSFPTTLCDGPDGTLYLPQLYSDIISCYGPDGSQSGSIPIKWPRSVYWTDAGLLVGHSEGDDGWVISVVSSDGRRRRRIATVRGEPRAIAAYEHFVAVGTGDGQLYLFDASHVI